MLDQSARVTGDDVRELLLDAGYFDDEVIDATIKREGRQECRPFLLEAYISKESPSLHLQPQLYKPAVGIYRRSHRLKSRLCKSDHGVMILALDFEPTLAN